MASLYTVPVPCPEMNAISDAGTPAVLSASRMAAASPAPSREGAVM